MLNILHIPLSTSVSACLRARARAPKYPLTTRQKSPTHLIYAYKQ